MVRRFLAELSAEQIPARITESSIIVLPLGAIEAHGHHLPLNTDFVVAASAAEALVEQFGEQFDLWALPPLAFTKSNEHAWAPGTVWLSAETMLRVLDEIARSVSETKAKKLVFLNAHGGNTSLLQVVLRDVRLKYGLQTFLVHPFRASGEGGELGMGIHGGFDETSVLLHLRPELVDMSKAIRQVPEHLAENRHVKWGGSVQFGWLSNDFEAEPKAGSLGVGVIGNPIGANAAHGATEWNAVLAQLGEAFSEIADWDPKRSVRSE